MTSMLLLAGIVRFSVPATGEGQVLPDSLPREAVKDAPCAMVAARGEYEGGSFVLRSDADLGKVECVNCGQCAAVCPTGAIVPKQDRNRVWDALYDPSKTVVVQIAPAVRVALGEYFGAKPP